MPNMIEIKPSHQPLTRRELELAMVRLAERFPNRVGPRRWGTCDNHCLLGQWAHDMGECQVLFVRHYDQGVANLIARLVGLNDAGMPWGQIIKELNLVPGEQPATELPTLPTPVSNDLVEV